jgi:hypothetical protein
LFDTAYHHRPPLKGADGGKAYNNGKAGRGIKVLRCNDSVTMP